MAKPKKATSNTRRSKANAGAADLLLEIGTEELPAQFIAPALRSLEESTGRLLKESRLSYDVLRALGTPRRLVLVVERIPLQQAASVVETMGPPKTAAFDPTGQPTKAALGFAQSQGVPVSLLEIRHTAKGEYVCAVRREEGIPARSVLQDLLPSLIGGLSFPKTMRWNVTGLRFARPIRWLLAVLGGRIVPFEVAGVRSGDRTYGHRFVGNKASETQQGRRVSSVAHYLKELSRSAVVPDHVRRREQIVAQLTALANSVKGQVDHDEALLEQAVFSVESPQAILGSFDVKYLSLPKDVLATSMKEHQGFFPLSTPGGKLLPRFISVTNTRVKNMSLIRAGNERVLAARLSDAQFFFQEDRKVSLAERVEGLKSMTFHQKLGTLHQKTGRVMALAARIADLLGDLDLLEAAKRAAQLSKADLLTGMVGEFPSLQGVMGGEYAALDGEPQVVCEAIRDQYLPTGMEGELPRTRAGGVLSLADRLDNIAAFFHVGIVPTGSEDPLGLRRHAAATTRILVEGGLRLDLREVLAHARRGVSTQGFPAATVPPQADKRRPTDPVEFIIDRLRYYARTVYGLRDDVMEAVLRAGVDSVIDLADLLARMRALQSMTERPEFDPLMVGFKRAHRLAQKEQWDRKPIDPSRFQHSAERELYRCLEDAQALVPKCLGQGEYKQGLAVLVGMKPAIDAFFEGVLVNAEDPALRANRLSLLEVVAQLFTSFADFSQITVESR